MSTKEPKNETYLAAELAQVMPPVRAAKTAQQLCAIGRAYRHMAERLCGGEEQWGAWSASVERAQERAYTAQGRRLVAARALVQGLPVVIEAESLTMTAVISEGRGPTKRLHTTLL